MPTSPGWTHGSGPSPHSQAPPERDGAVDPENHSQPVNHRHGLEMRCGRRRNAEIEGDAVLLSLCVF